MAASIHQRHKPQLESYLRTCVGREITIGSILERYIQELLVLSYTTLTMSLDPPGYILSLQNNIRARPISWEGAVRAKTLTDSDLKKIKAIDKVRKEQRKQTVESDVNTYTTLLLGNNETKSIFESTAKRTDILNYMLVLTGDLIEGQQSCSMYRAVCMLTESRCAGTW